MPKATAEKFKAARRESWNFGLSLAMLDACDICEDGLPALIWDEDGKGGEGNANYVCICLDCLDYMRSVLSTKIKERRIDNA